MGNFNNLASSGYTLDNSDQTHRASILFGPLIGYLIRITGYISHFIVKIIGRSWEEGPEKSIRQRATLKLKGRFVRDNTMVIYPGFFGFALMRSLEINMCRNVLGLFEGPVLDLGCGDGGFSSLLFKEIDAGIDLDGRVLETARQLNIYDKLERADATKKIPFGDNSFGTVFSNSVVEHIKDVDLLVKEVARVTRRRGHFIFTTYTDDFTKYLAQSFGEKDARLLNQGMSHISLYSVDFWSNLLEKYGFKVKFEYYLPYKTVIHFRLLKNPVLQFTELILGKVLWKSFRANLWKIVKRSIHLNNKGAGILVIAQKLE